MHTLQELPLQPNQHHTIRRAWAMLLAAFVVFCVLLASTVSLIWNYHRHATVSHSSRLILRTSSEWVNVQRKGRTTFERATHQQPLNEGDRVRVISSAGYGQAATLRLFDQSTLDMWAGTNLELEHMETTRWTSRQQTIVLHQIDGYVRYDLNPESDYHERQFRVRVGLVEIALAPGGSYSVAVLPAERHVVMLTSETYDPVRVDVAVRSGQAVVHGQGHTETLTAGQRVEVDPAGIPTIPRPATWQLIRDGCFNAYTEQEYNNTTITTQPDLIRSRTWKVFSGPAEAGASGFFKLSHTFTISDDTNVHGNTTAACNLAWFLRSGGQTRGFTTGVHQMLGPDQIGMDISEYHSLTFSAWVRVLNQSIDLAGEQGTECPIMIQFNAKQSNPTDAEQKPVMCLYTSDNPAREPVHAPGVSYFHLAPYRWHHIQVELRASEWLPDARYLQSIRIYANGHDYNSQATRVSLVGTHYNPATNIHSLSDEFIP